MSGFDILTLVGEPWNDSAGLFGGIDVTVTDTASLPTSKFLEFVLNGASIYKVLKTGETIISDATGTSLGGIKLAGSAGEMALTSQIDATTSAPAEALRYSWEDTAHVGSDPASGSVLQGMGASNFSIEGAAKITHIAGSSAYAWSGLLGTRLIWTANTAATNDGRTIDFTNLGQTNRASPIVSVSAANTADDLIHFGISDGTNWNVAAKIDAAGRGQLQMLDLPEQGAPGDPAVGTARLYGKSVNGSTKIAFRDSSGSETVLGSTISVAGGTVTTSTPVASFSQTWNDSAVTFSAITANVADQGSRTASSLIDLKVNSGSVFQVRKSGETVISNVAGTSTGGMALRGNAGEMAMTSQIDLNSGLPADVFRWYWEDSNHVGSDAASVAVLRGMGRNRLSIESSGALVHIAQTARYEWEGLGSERLRFLGYEAASAKGKTFDFNNLGQTPTRASPVVSISIDESHPEDDPLHIGTINSNAVWQPLARFDGTGGLHVPRVDAVGTTGGTTTRYTAALDTDTEVRAQIGLDSADRGMIKLGIGGTTAPDVMLSRGPFAGCLDISNGTNPTQIRIYRTYGADAEFWNMTWRLTSPPWASIRTNWSGNGAARNICIEPALLGLGIPVGNGSNIPALKRVATQLQVRLGDDSDFTAIRGKLTTADSAVPEVIVATHTLTLYDASGTAYKVPCVAA